MIESIIRFEDICGPHQSKRDNFEQLINHLFSDKSGFTTFNGSGGDGGADCLFFEDDGKRVVVQAKYFLRKISNTQRQQVKRSFLRALEVYQPHSWILCTPLDPTPKEYEWLMKFAEGYQRVSFLWWGYTKLSAEILKREEIINYYFPNIKFSNRIINLEKNSSKIYNTVVQLRKYLIDCGHVLNTSHDYSYMALEYLRRLSYIMPGIKKELSFIESHDTFEILIDFMDIYSFMNAHPLQIGEMTISDFCIRNSDMPIRIPPGSLYEMEQYLYAIKNYNREIDKKEITFLLTDFILKYERNQNNIETYNSYEKLVRYLNKFGIRPDVGFGKLKMALIRGIIQPLAEEDIVYEADKVFFDRVFKWFSKLRPLKPEPNLADAANLELLSRMREKRKGMIRFLSSAKSFSEAAMSFYGENHLVITAIQYAMIINMKRWYNDKVEYIRNIENFLGDMERLIAGMENILMSSNVDAILNTNDRVSAIEMVNNLHKFDAFYKSIFKPIDEMVFKELELMEPMKRQSPEGLYRLLVSDTDVIIGFENWWNETLQEVDELSKYLTNEFGIENTVKRLEELGGKPFIEEKKLAEEKRKANKPIKRPPFSHTTFV